MADPHVLSQLRSKRDAIEAYIRNLEEKVLDAQKDLTHINATIRLFQVNGETPQFPLHMGIARMFKRGELFGYCLAALQAAPDGLSTRELALHCIREKGLDAEDKVLRQAIAVTLLNVLTKRAQKGLLSSGDKRKGVRVWIKPEAIKQ